LLGKEFSPLKLSGMPPVIMLVGLQGSGKTTTAAKLAKNLTKQNYQPLLSACDNRRPAASEQLEILARENQIAFSPVDPRSALGSAKRAVEMARKNFQNLVILDTAGRLHIEKQLMEELKDIKNVLNPADIILVVDAMTGQDAVNVAETFDHELGLTGVILTKLDGDTRGGAALSIRQVTGVPIKFAGTGEKVDDLMQFHPSRMASRILGMGDIVTLVEKAKEITEQEEAEKFARKLQKMTFTLDDFLKQLQNVKKLGPLENVLSMLPGGLSALKNNVQISDKQLNQVEAIIRSMTIEERNNPRIINLSRKKRIAKGSGNKIGEVTKLIKQFDNTKKMMKKVMGKQQNSFSPLTKKFNKG
jgi:signal recognition particle subunit SRP54